MDTDKPPIQIITLNTTCYRKFLFSKNYRDRINVERLNKLIPIDDGGANIPKFTYEVKTLEEFRNNKDMPHINFKHTETVTIIILQGKVVFKKKNANQDYERYLKFSRFFRSLLESLTTT